MTPLIKELKELYRKIFYAAPVDLIACVSWIAILLTLTRKPTALIIFSLLTPMVFYSSRIRSNPYFWFLAAFYYIAFFMHDWFLTEEGVYLLFYWLLAIGFGLLTNVPEKILAFNGRILTGIAFLFAVFWKATSPDYMSGDFFNYSLLFDVRFQCISELFCGAESEVLETNRLLVHNIYGTLQQTEPISFRGLSCTKWLVPLLKWWTLFIEALVAFFCLVPSKRFTPHLRSSVLLIFYVTTYLFIPVGQFLGVIFLLGISQLLEEQPLSKYGQRLWNTYIATFLFFILYAAFYNSFLLPVSIR